MKRGTAIAILLVLLAVPAAASAGIDLRFDPPDTNLQAGETGRLSILVDDVIEIRTIDVTVTYDTTVVRSIGGAAGALYVDSGVFTFDGFEEDTLGTWHGYAVLMGAGLFVEGPGELYAWDFEALADGVSPITTIGVHLSTTDGSWFEEVSLLNTSVIVGEGPTGVPEASGRASLELWPNPFNPAVRIRGDVPADGRAVLTVFDARGRRIAAPLDAMVPAGPLTATWNGRRFDGRAAPAGVYFFRLEAPGLRAVTKGVLVE